MFIVSIVIIIRNTQWYIWKNRMPIHKEKENRNSEMPGQPVMKCAGAHIYRALRRPLAAMLGYILIF